jgi:hypothetical protein
MTPKQEYRRQQYARRAKQYKEREAQAVIERHKVFARFIVEASQHKSRVRELLMQDFTLTEIANTLHLSRQAVLELL